MDNPNITMEEYIRLEEEKARRHGKVYNWETAMYGKIWYDEDVHDLRSVETKFQAIVFNDELSSEKTLSCEPTIWLFHLGIRGISILGLRDYSTLMLISWILRRGRMLMEHKDAQGQTVFTSQAWRRLFEIRGPLVHELILEFFSTFRFKEGVLDLDIGSNVEIMHRFMPVPLLGGGQTPEKVTVTDLFYLRGMDVGSVNIPYLLARNLRIDKIVREDSMFMIWFELVVVAGVPDATEDDPVADEGAPAVPTPMYEIRGALGEQREILDSMACDFSQFSTWTVVGLSQMMSQVGVIHQLCKLSDPDLAAKKSTKLVKYRSSGILCVIVVMLEYRRIYNTHSCS
ncbi:hypothetical protein Tco_0122336 [Tanacetum coccineum]